MGISLQNYNFLKKADWLDLGAEITMGMADLDRNLYLEAPSNIGRDIKMLRNILFGRNSYYLSPGMLSPNTIIGRYCSLSQFVNIGSTNHNMNALSTGCLSVDMSELRAEGKESDIYTIIGCDVWIGVSATVLCGRKIGHGAVIGAGSVVTKDIPPYAVAVGNPAHVIKYRFPEDIVNTLLELKWWTLDPVTLSKLPKDDVIKCIEAIRDIRLKANN
jgi:acetyltransferase-like isoleucine patch superfamily enzyme